MKFKVSQEDLASGLQLVQRAVAARAPMPVLAGILVETTPEGLTLTATDQEIGVRVSVPATVSDDGALVLPTRIGDIVRKFPFGEVSVETEEANNTATVTWERSRFVIHGFPAGDFPPFPEPPERKALTLSKGDLRRLVRQTGFAVSHDDSRPVFTGVLVTVEDGRVRFVATDGFRLAVAEGLVGPDSAETRGDFIIPGRALAEVARVLGEEGDGTVALSLAEKRAFFEADGQRVVCRLIEGQFPPYKQVIPKQFVTRMTCSTQGLLDACERASLIARDVGQAIRLHVNGTSLVITASVPEVGTAREEVPIESQGDSLEIAFNPRYLVDGLRNIDTEKLVYDFTGPLSPSCIRPLCQDESAAPSFTYVVLPMRLIS
ncbi:MAG: DNA polymerase III subunit beta [Bacillota bacterium]|jgi:DNA polymerase-3 subunit beta